MALVVLVTGGTGVLGQQIVNGLRLAGYEVIQCSRSAEGNSDAVWDITRQAVPEPNYRPAIVVHTAARVGHYQQPLSEAIPLCAVNVLGTLRVAQWCASQGVKRLILISGAIVYGEWVDSPKTESDPVKPWVAGPYAVSKWCSEQVAHLVAQAGCELIILRLSSLYGVGYDNGLIQRMLQQGYRTGGIGLKPPFDDAFDLLHVSDAARTVQSAIENKQAGLWNVGGGKLITIRELAETCARQVNVQVLLSGVEPSRPARILNWVNDQKARIELNHASQVTLDIGIEEIARSLRGNNNTRSRPAGRACSS